jgi:lipopolysaccharide/colanic/teichoic acid biosynthesis glycosyltransferase
MKRLVDIVLAILISILLFFPIVVVVILIYYNLGKPVFFKQFRPGYLGKPFELVKFRTMSNDLSSDGKLLPDHMRIKPFGQFLRSTSFDEIPELWNVITGDMSLVGPRPLLMEYLPLYNHEQARRHCVRPGITGYAQVNGRNNLSWEEKFKLDLWYVDNHNILLDFKIIFLTLIKVSLREGISAKDEATMYKFQGSINKDDHE